MRGAKVKTRSLFSGLSFRNDECCRIIRCMPFE